jgi:hypothetical protein
MLSRRQEAWALIAAACLHAAAFGVVRSLLPASPDAERSASPATSAEVAWDIDLGHDAPVEQTASDDEPAQEKTQGTRVAVRERTRELPPADTLLAPEDESFPGEDPPALDSRAEEATEATAQRPIDLGVGADGWQRWLGPPHEQVAKPTEPRQVRSNRFQVFRAPPVSTTGGVQEGLEKRDRELGLGPSGRVLSALHAAAHETIAPSLGTARFEVTVLNTGAIEVKLGGASGEPAGWQKVAARIAEKLRAAPPRIGPPRAGARLIVELVAEETMPNGTKISSLKGPHLEAMPLRLHSTEDAKKQAELDNPTATTGADTTPQPPIKLDLPGVYVAGKGKVCSYRLGVSPLGPVLQGGCDPSQIGAKPLRMVRARVLEETLF